MGPLEAEAAAAEIEAVANDYSAPAVRADLQILANALRDPIERQRWSGVDLTRHFPPDLVKPEALAYVGSRASRFLEIVRVPTVFLPIIWTWFGLWLALGAFSDLLNADPSADQRSFISLWESGFGGRTSLTLGRVAIVDVLLVASAVGVALASGWLDSRDELQRDAIVQTSANRLRSALFRATVELRSDVFASDEDFEERLRQVIESLQALGVLVDLAEALGSAVPVFSESVQTLATSSDQILDGVRSLDRSAGGLATQTEDLVRRQTLVASGVEHAVTSLTAGTSSLETATAQAAEILRSLDGTREHLSTALEAGTAGVAAMRGVVRDAAAHLLEAQEAGVGLSATFTETVTRVGEVGENLAARLQQTSAELAAAATIQVELTAEAQAAAQSFAVFRAALLDHADDMLGWTPADGRAG